METLSDKEILFEKNLDTGEMLDVLYVKDVKEFIRKLKEELRGIPVRESNSGDGDKYQDIIEIWKRIDALAGEKLI